MSQFFSERQADDAIDGFLRRFKSHLLPAARLCLLSTFIEDGLRMLLQRSAQMQYFRSQWHSGWFIAGLFVFFNLFVQLVPSAMILARKKIPIAVGCLMSSVLVQTIAYKMLTNLHFMARNLGVVGGLLFLLAEGGEDAKRIFGLLPQLETKETKKNNVLQLFGRVLIGLMFLTLLKFNGAFRIAFELVGFTLLVMVLFGYKAKMASFALMLLLLLENVFFNAFWFYSPQSSVFDFKLYDFFQTMSVIGGLLMVVVLGPGGISFDENKKAL